MTQPPTEIVKRCLDTVRGTASTDGLEAVYPDVERYRSEYDATARPLVEQAREAVRDADVHAGDMNDDACRELYAAVRAVDADVVLETGVASGISTTALLAAVKETSGRVVSIDLPFHVDSSLTQRRRATYEEFGGAAVPSDATSGWAIPQRLTDDWTLHEGKTQRLLPDVLAELPELDVFVHDSEHSRLCMSYELEAAWPRLQPDGLAVCDDVSWSGAWREFLERRVPDDRHGELADDVGYAVKPECINQ